MTEIHEAPKANSPRTEAEAEDLSQAIKLSLEKGAGEQVRCVRVYGNRYRCNWWLKDEDNGTAGRIIRSRFLKATQTPDGLLIEDLTNRLAK
ncbi:MAG TPA: hypothetical protein VHP11_01230 [Tepidisphaeraceae bacterium]|nr:hypothetical protein [Tepidisphaeraceae bacterium]